MYKNEKRLVEMLFKGEICYKTEKYLYFNNLDIKEIERYTIKNNTKTIIANFCIKSVKKTMEDVFILEIENISDGIKTVEGRARDIIEKLKDTGYVVDSRNLEIAVFGYINNKQRNGELKKVADEKYGVVIKDERIDFVGRNVEIGDWKEGANVFSKLLSFYKNKGRAAFVIVYSALLSLHYWLKRKGILLKYLYLYGPSRSGKSTLIRISQLFWPAIEKKSGAQISSPYTFSKALDDGYYCIVADEPKSLFEDSEIVEMIKTAQQDFEIRSRKHDAYLKTYIARSGLALVSNFSLPKDSALINRFIIVKTEVADKDDIAKKELEFEAFYRSLPNKRKDMVAFFKKLLEEIYKRINDQNVYTIIDEALAEILKEAGIDKDFKIDIEKIDEVKVKEDMEIVNQILKDMIIALRKEYIEILGKPGRNLSLTSMIRELAESEVSHLISKRGQTYEISENILPSIKIRDQLSIEDLGYLFNAKIEVRKHKINEKIIFYRKVLVINEMDFEDLIKNYMGNQEIEDVESRPAEGYEEYLEEKYNNYL
jgi:hypothetical protein